jgi:hypothetical protein
MIEKDKISLDTLVENVGHEDSEKSDERECFT